MLTVDTIAAISTPPGEGAVAVIRVSGPDAVRITNRLFKGRASLDEAAPRFVHFGRIVDADGVAVDDVLLTVFHAPASYTGENVVEISGHGGPLVSAKILALVLAAGARAAEPGEFTQRAFVNGKLDLTQAEAVMDLIRAQTPLALRAAADQLQGRIGDAVEEIRVSLLNLVAHVEAYIDFPEEGIDPDTGDALLARLDVALSQVRGLLETAGEGRILREGVRLAICGRPNVGKSSLLNRLVGFDRAIVSAAPGTTRDTIEECVSLRGIPFRMVDTAGLRETSDTVESEGVKRAQKAASYADVVLRVVDATDSVISAAPPLREDEIVVINKIDLVRDEDRTFVRKDSFCVSCVTGEGFEDFVDALVARVCSPQAARRESLAAINARHQACLMRAEQSLVSAANALRAGVEPEFVAIDLRLALEAVGEVVGKVSSEEILDEIFGRFCIGK